MDQPAPHPAVATPVARPPHRRHRRIAAGTAAIGCALWLVSYFFLPWMTFQPAQRQRVREAFQPEIDLLEARAPERAARYRALLARIVDDGALSGVDLFRYARLAHETNRDLQGEPPTPDAKDREWVVQRLFPMTSRLLAAMAAACAALLFSLVGGGLRGLGTLRLAALLVVGVIGGALGLAWQRWADSLSADVLRGGGLTVCVAASLAQTCAGLFGVSARNWWRTYALAAFILALVGAAAWSNVLLGWTP
jgi:hypothetical protein